MNVVRNIWAEHLPTDVADDVDRVNLVFNILYMMVVHGVFPDFQYQTSVITNLGPKEGPEVLPKLQKVADELSKDQKMSIYK